jgi:hypothetical protein
MALEMTNGGLVALGLLVSTGERERKRDEGRKLSAFSLVAWGLEYCGAALHYFLWSTRTIY